MQLFHEVDRLAKLKLECSQILLGQSSAYSHYLRRSFYLAQKFFIKMLGFPVRFARVDIKLAKLYSGFCTYQFLTVDLDLLEWPREVLVTRNLSLDALFFVPARAISKVCIYSLKISVSRKKLFRQCTRSHYEGYSNQSNSGAEKRYLVSVTGKSLLFEIKICGIMMIDKKC